MLTLRSMFLLCSRICVVCLVLELLGSCVVVGFGVGMEVLHGLLFLNVLCSQEFSG